MNKSQNDEISKQLKSGIQDIKGNYAGTKRLRNTIIDEATLEHRVVHETAQEAKSRYAQEAKELRIKGTGLSQAGMAQAVGVSPKAVQAWEQGSNPVPGPVRRIIEIMNEFPDVRKKLTAGRRAAASSRPRNKPRIVHKRASTKT